MTNVTFWVDTESENIFGLTYMTVTYLYYHYVALTEFPEGLFTHPAGITCFNGSATPLEEVTKVFPKVPVIATN